MCLAPPSTTRVCSFVAAAATLGGKRGAWWIDDYRGLDTNAADTVHRLRNDTRTRGPELFTAAVRWPER
jgi:hypothetical protein